MATAASAGRSGGGRREQTLLFAASAGAATCVLLAIALASGRLSVAGVPAPGVAGFLLVVAWCFTHRRVERTLAAMALYLGLLDGYLKLRTGSATLTLARDALVLAIAAGALLRASTGTQRLRLPPLSGFVIAFTALVVVEFANPTSHGLTASLAGMRQHLEFVPLFFLGYAFLRTESQVRKALFVVVLCAAAGGVVSYIQSRLSPAQLAAWGPGYAERIDGTGLFTGAAQVAFLSTGTSVRPFGLGSEIGAGAVAAALALPGMVALLVAAKGWLRWSVAALSIGIGLAIATSGSRGALVTVAASLVAFALLAAASKNALKAAVGLAVAMGLVYFAFVQLGTNTATAQRAQTITPSNFFATFTTERGSSVLQFSTLVRQHPFGVGLGTVGPASSVTPSASASGTGYNSETEWNFLVIELGLAGVIVYVAFLVRLMWLAVTRTRHVANPTMRLYLAALAAPILALAVAGFGGPTSATAPTAPYLWLVSGMLAYWLVTAYDRAPRGSTTGQGLSRTGSL